MSKILIYLLLCSKLIFLTCSPTLKLPVLFDENKIPGIDIEIGHPPEKVVVFLSTLFNKFMISSSANYNPERSTTSIDTGEEFEYREKIAKIFEETIRFNADDEDPTTIKNFKIIQLQNDKFSYSYHGVLGWSYRYSNKDDEDKYSFTKQLIKAGIIDRDIFYLSLNYSGYPFITFGDYPKWNTRNDYRYKTAKLVLYNKNTKNNSEFQTLLNAVYWSDGTFWNVNKRLTISIGGGACNISNSLFDIIVDKYFEKAISKDQCKIKNSEDNNYKEIWCDSDFMSKGEYISLIWGKFSIRWYISDLFYPTRNKTKKLLTLRTYKNTNYEWALTYYALRKYNIVFDKENEELGFYNNAY